MKSPTTLTREAFGVYLRHLAEGAEGLALVSVGGVETPLDLWERLKAGASLVQVYTGFVYEGPFLPRSIASGMLAAVAAESGTALADLLQPRGRARIGSSSSARSESGTAPIDSAAAV